MTDTTRPIPNEPDDYPTNGVTRRNTPTPSRVVDTEAERAVISACLFADTATVANATTTGLKPEHFTDPARGHIWRAILDLHEQGVAADPTTVTDQLARNHITNIGTGVLHELGTTPLAYRSNVANYADILIRLANTHNTILALADAANDIQRGAEPEAVIVRLHNRLPTIQPDGHERTRLIDGAAFLLDEPDEIPAIWGHGDTCLWAEGEATMIVGPTGIGKTTVAQQVALGRIGLRTNVIGQPVCPGRNRVLYLACDRPRQAARSMRRMVSEQDRDTLHELVYFWKGPPPFDLVADPKSLARFAKKHGADTVVIDSLKDVCHKLNDDEHASKTNAAIQECIADGIEITALHHQRKAGASAKKDVAPKTIDEVYGNTWLTAGMGSVILIWGQPGDPFVELTHLKAPADQVGPWTLHMDFDLGYTTIDEEISPLKIVLGAPRGATAKLVAATLYKKEEPDRNELEKARRRLDKLVDQGRVHRQETPNETGGKPTTLYFPVERNRTA